METIWVQSDLFMSDLRSINASVFTILYLFSVLYVTDFLNHVEEANN